ncbi:hypothetical protein JK628_02890 [Shewanella sp. KX20019]|uniref:hypothetical protein n=1 Tax=Shewanella sp. KX20019 TaxID=2803864 RepID=UPI0019267063|nr:hypothetical protein [Shewanella sp. KX20019]QQX80836.1 hypothetical protein JK628_02890 [Shewanella sp. KX20019]
MNDIADKSQIAEEQFLNISLAIRKEQLTPKGACFNCLEPITTGKNKLFCDCDCREDYEKRTANGGS